MKIIDAHIHSLPNMAGMKEFCAAETLLYDEVNLLGEMKSCEIVAAVTMTCDLTQATPIELKEIREQAERFNGALIPVVGVNPHKPNVEQLVTVLCDGDIRGVKIYPGYEHMALNSAVYHKIYEFAGENKVPVIVHTGDTFWKGKAARDSDGNRLAHRKHYGDLSVSHPINIEKVANDFPDTDFILAHAGNPWFDTAAALAYHNENVFLDLSGLLIGSNVLNNPMVPYLENDIKKLITYVGKEKILYGSDWPLVTMQDYVHFIKQAIPADAQQAIFYDNAKKLFKLKD